MDTRSHLVSGFRIATTRRSRGKVSDPGVLRERTGQIKPRGQRHGRSGYILHAVLILLALLAIGVILTLRDTTLGLQEARNQRALAEIDGALEHGLNLAISQIQATDPADLVNPAMDWDIFKDPPSNNTFVLDSNYPPAGPLMGAYRVRVGLRRGQLTQGATGQSVDGHYGQVLEVQVLVTAIDVALPPAEERLSVGVLVPRERSHAN
ncbi:MAG: hypothetical protein IPK13_11220 [Deltaproteobacteria bacterium]|nr:hypothetical protein [Deltaproteobacteria bacterium]